MSFPWQSIEPESVRLQSLLSENYYGIPPNQREFSWSAEDQVARLWEDLKACVEADFPLRPGTPGLGHFLGTLVVIGESHTDGESRQQVIDGQQRLTTITVLVRVLLDALDIELVASSEKQSANVKLLPMLYHDIAGTMYPRLVLNREDKFFHKSTIELSSAKKREEFWALKEIDNKDARHPKVRIRIVQAYRKLSKFLQEELDKAGSPGDLDRNQLLTNYVNALCDYFYVLKVRCEDTRMAYRLFETLNERGLDLSQADLVRNVVLEQASLSRKKFNDATKAWDNMLDWFDQQDPELLKKVPELLQFSYSSRYESVKAEGLFEKISTELRKKSLQSDILAREFETDAAIWKMFLDGSAHWNAEALDSYKFIIHIKPIWKKHCVPLLIRVAERFDKKGKAAELGKALWAIECYLFREGAINNAPISRLEKDFSEAARIVGEAGSSDHDFVKLLSSRSPDAEFKNNFAIATAKTKLAFYIAWRMEKYKLGPGGYDMGGLRPERHSPAQHLEHIMPKKPDSTWKGIDNKDEFSHYLDRLGNHLVLERRVNASIRNSCISAKVKNTKKPQFGYEGQKLELPKEVAAKSADWYPNGDWNFESIEARQKYLADNYAVQVWKIRW